MTEDLARLAREREAARDWEGAEAAWGEAQAARHPDAADGFARARRAISMTHDLCAIASESLDRGNLREAMEPLRAAIELSGETNPAVAPLERKWRDLKRDITREQRTARQLVNGIGAGVGFAAGIGMAILFWPSGGAGKITVTLYTLVGAATGAVAAAVAKRFFPVLERGRVGRLKLTRPAPKKSHAGKMPPLRARSSRIARWKRAAERERQGGSGFWD